MRVLSYDIQEHEYFWHLCCSSKTSEVMLAAQVTLVSPNPDDDHDSLEELIYNYELHMFKTMSLI